MDILNLCLLWTSNKKYWVPKKLPVSHKQVKDKTNGPDHQLIIKAEK